LPQALPEASSGVSPSQVLFDPEQVLKRFIKIDDERPSFSKSSQLILKPQDWKHIEKFLKQTVRNF
jgi:hypothetical protein